MSSTIAIVATLFCGICYAQTATTVLEDFKPSTLNQPGQQYPQVNSQGYARFRIVAPYADTVRVSLGPGGTRGGTLLTKVTDSVWMGTTSGPMEEGFHYYRVTIDGGVFNYPGTLNGGIYKPEELTDKSKVKLIFMSCGSFENPAGVTDAADTLKLAGFNAVSFVSENTRHEFQTWRRSLYVLAPMLFKD